MIRLAFPELSGDPLPKLIRAHAGDLGVSLNDDEFRIMANELWYRIALRIRDKPPSPDPARGEVQRYFDETLTEVVVELSMHGFDRFVCPYRAVVENDPPTPAAPS